MYVYAPPRSDGGVSSKDSACMNDRRMAAYAWSRMTSHWAESAPFRSQSPRMLVRWI